MNTVEAKSGASKRLRKTKEGVVVSNKMEKTVVVAVTRQVKHAQYGKYVRHTKKYMAHDKKGECGIGDSVRIAESRPISRRKSWKVCEIITKAV